MRRDEDKKSTKELRVERERVLRRESIIKVAEQFFIAHGYDQTMIEQVAEEAGYTKPTIYNYFDSKDDLFIAVVAKTFERLHKVFENTMNQQGVAYDLRSLGDAYLVFVEKYPDEAGLFEVGRLGHVIGDMIKKEEKGESLTESEEEFRLHQKNIENLMTEIISETIRKSDVEGKVDPFSVIMVLSSLGGTIRDLVLQGLSGSQPVEKTREYLSVLFNIIDKGLKHYDD